MRFALPPPRGLRECANGGERGKISAIGWARTICKSFSVIVQSGWAKKIKKLVQVVVCERNPGIFPREQLKKKPPEAYSGG